MPTKKQLRKYWAEKNKANNAMPTNDKCNSCHNNPKEKHSDYCIKCNKRHEDFDNQSYDNMMKKSGAINIDHLTKIAESVEKQRKEQDKNAVIRDAPRDGLEHSGRHRR